MASWMRWEKCGPASIAVLLLALHLNGCNGFFIDPALTEIVVSPSSPSIVVGKTQQMTATATYDNGVKSSVTSEASWSSSDVSIAIVSATGLVTGIASGSATISATDEGINGSTPVSVVTSALVSISITPTSVSLSPGQSQQFSAEGRFADGTTSTMTKSVTWESSDTSIATIDSSGYCVAKSGSTSGSTKISATSGTINSNSVTVDVQ